VGVVRVRAVDPSIPNTNIMREGGRGEGGREGGREGGEGGRERGRGGRET
jgi:hypothetical protein